MIAPIDFPTDNAKRLITVLEKVLSYGPIEIWKGDNGYKVQSIILPLERHSEMRPTLEAAMFEYANLKCFKGQKL